MRGMGNTSLHAEYVRRGSSKSCATAGKSVSIEQIVELPLSELHPPEFHPFQVRDDIFMQMLLLSVEQYGVREPGLCRPRTEGGYELLCGNRRKRACELAGLMTMPVIVRELDDATAMIAMVDSNLQQRDKILPSEKAWAYRVKMEALNQSSVERDGYSYEIMVKQTGESKNQIYRFIRLTELIMVLIDLVDARQLAFNPAVELSYLSIVEQTAVAEVMAKHEVKPSLSQAVRLKKLKHEDKLTSKQIDQILSETKKLPRVEQSETARFSRFFPANYTPKQMDAVIVKLLTEWKERVAV